MVDRKASAPVFAGRMLLGDEVVGMVERHENDDQPAQGIQWEKTLALRLHHQAFGLNSANGAMDFRNKNSDWPEMM